MSNFEDYDLSRGSSSRNNSRSTSRTTSRPSNRNYTDRNSNPYDEDYEFYEYDADDQYEYSRSSSQSRNRNTSSRSRTQSSSNRRSTSSSNAKRKTSQGSRPSSKRSSSSRQSSTRNTSVNRNNGRTRASSNKKGTAKRTSQKKKARRTLLIVEIVILLLLLIVFFFWNKFGKVNWDNIDMEDIEVNELDAQTEEVLSNYTTLALFGVDNRSNGNLDSGNSDTIILVAINNDTKEVKMVSVQRDTYLQITEGTYRKCNYAYNHGGVETAISMLNTNLDLKISGYISVDFYALATVVDDLGGLDLYVTQKMIDTNNPETGQNALAGYIAEVENVLNYYPNQEDGWKYDDAFFFTNGPGTYHLNGAQVVGYCRNRYAVDNDYGRAENQRTVIKLIMEKAKKASVSQLNDIANDVFPSISTSLSLSQILSMAASVGDYEIAESSGFPFALKTTTISKTTGSVVVPCTLASNTSSLHKFLYDQDDYDPTDAVDTISSYIVNQTGFTEGSAEINQTSDE